jgi:hypothetical protein
MAATVSLCSPGVSEVEEMVDDGLARLQHVAQADLSGPEAWFGSPIRVHRQPISPLGDGELPKVIIEPARGGLNEQDQMKRPGLPGREVAIWRGLT